MIVLNVRDIRHRNRNILLLPVELQSSPNLAVSFPIEGQECLHHSLVRPPVVYYTALSEHWLQPMDTSWCLLCLNISQILLFPVSAHPFCWLFFKPIGKNSAPNKCFSLTTTPVLCDWILWRLLGGKELSGCLVPCGRIKLKLWNWCEWFNKLR